MRKRGTRIVDPARLALTILVCAATAGCSGDDDGGDLGTTTTSVVAGTTTSTTNVSTPSSSTITTSSTIGDLTTTTTLGDSCGCVVTFAVTNSETLGALQYDTDYSAAGGGFDGIGGNVDCVKRAGDFAAFNDVDAEHKLSSAVISTAGFTGPIDVVQCSYTSIASNPVPSEFVITITNQSHADFSPANATVEVRDVTCTCTGSTTTTTTTTLPEVGDPYIVSFDLEDAVTLGALQLRIDYGSTGGNFEGNAEQVNCSSPLTAGGAFVSFNDYLPFAQLNAAFVSLTGFTGPTTVASCTFLAPAAPPAPGDFVVDVVDASTLDFQPVDATVSVSAIMPEAP